MDVCQRVWDFYTGGKMKVEGQCHCGAVAYEAQVEPGTIAICHCTDCQTLTGSAFRANIAARAEHFRITRGMPRKYVKTADSGAKRVHAFCEACGSPIYSSALENPASFSLRVGALKQRHELGRPVREIWVSRRLGWVPRVEGTEEVQGQR